MTPVRLEPVALRSRVKHSTTEPLRFLHSSVNTIALVSFAVLVHAPQQYTRTGSTVDRHATFPYSAYSRAPPFLVVVVYVGEGEGCWVQVFIYTQTLCVCSSESKFHELAHLEFTLIRV